MLNITIKHLNIITAIVMNSIAVLWVKFNFEKAKTTMGPCVRTYDYLSMPEFTLRITIIS